MEEINEVKLNQFEWESTFSSQVIFNFWKRTE